MDDFYDDMDFADGDYDGDFDGDCDEDEFEGDEFEGDGDGDGFASSNDAVPEPNDGLDWDDFTLGVGFGIEMCYGERRRKRQNRDDDLL